MYRTHKKFDSVIYPNKIGKLVSANMVDNDMGC